MSLMTEIGSPVHLRDLPRVNLLPPEIAERLRFRRIQGGMAGAVLAAVGLVVLLYVAASSSVGAAQSNLATVAAKHASLQADTARYQGVTAVYARAAAAQAMLTQAMGEEVRFSQLLNDLTLSIPENVWIKSLTVAQAPVGGAAGVSTPGIGTVNVAGIGFSHDDVAVWLESLARQKNYSDPYFSSSAETLLGTRKIVNFTSTATLTSAAYSGRYTSPAGG